MVGNKMNIIVGHYLLADARHHHNSKTRIQTVQLPKGVNCIQFSYFAHGSQSKSFLVKAEVPGRVNHVIKRWDGDQPNQWTTQRINMNVPIPWFVSMSKTMTRTDQLIGTFSWLMARLFKGC